MPTQTCLVVQSAHHSPKLTGADAEHLAASLRELIGTGAGQHILDVVVDSPAAVTVDLQGGFQVIDCLTGTVHRFVPENRRSGTDMRRASAMASMQAAQLTAAYRARNEVKRS